MLSRANRRITNVETEDNDRSATIHKAVRRPRPQKQPIMKTSANGGGVQEGKVSSRNDLIRMRFLTILPLAAASPESNKTSVEHESTGRTTSTRSFTLSTQVDENKVSAKLVDSVVGVDDSKDRGCQADHGPNLVCLCLIHSGNIPHPISVAATFE